MDFNQFSIMFKAIYLQGFCRPKRGVRALLDILVQSYKERGGELRLRESVAAIVSDDKGVTVELESGQMLQADQVLSSVGYIETQKLLGLPPSFSGVSGEMTFVESIYCLDRKPQSLDINAAITFYSTQEDFQYRKSADLVDCESGIICCPNNFAGAAPEDEGRIRITNIANYDRWNTTADYQKSKSTVIEQQLTIAEQIIPAFRNHIVYSDSFTPLTIKKFTGHERGCVYGSQKKFLTGDIGIKGVYLCGTDQGYLGIIGALTSGILMANQYGLRE